MIRIIEIESKNEMHAEERERNTLLTTMIDGHIVTSVSFSSPKDAIAMMIALTEEIQAELRRRDAK